jgi:hypothetical protein
VHFERLLASHAVRVSGQIEGDKLIRLTAQADRAMAWVFRIPQRLAATTQFAPGVAASQPDAVGLVPMTCTLKAGTTRLV